MLCLEAMHQTRSWSSALAAEWKAIFHWWVSQLIFSQKNFKKYVWLSRSYQIYLSSAVTNSHMLSFHSFLPCLFSRSLSPSSSYRPVHCVQFRHGSCPCRWIPVRQKRYCIHRHLKRTRQPLLSNPCVCVVARLANEGVFAPAMTLRNRQDRKG